MVLTPVRSDRGREGRGRKRSPTQGGNWPFSVEALCRDAFWSSAQLGRLLNSLVEEPFRFLRSAASHGDVERVRSGMPPVLDLLHLGSDVHAPLLRR
jgi:hypothetical protein